MKDNLSKLIAGKKFMLIASLLGLYLLSTGTTWAIFSFLREEPGASRSVAEGRGRIDPNLPKTEECLINGKMFSKPERDIWEERRPIAAIIENNLDARPLSGLSRADVVYEAVAEGGITRFLAVFYCGASAYDMKTAVVRSARVYYINWAAEYGNDPIFLHWGGANNICGDCPGGAKPRSQIDPRADAYGLLNRMGWYGGTAGNDFNGGHNIGIPAVVREPDRLMTGKRVAEEHKPVAFLDEVFKEAQKRGFGYKDQEGKVWSESYVAWRFADDDPLADPRASRISFEFWTNKPDYDVRWEYDPSNNQYLRFNGGEPFVDWEFDSQQVAAKNVLVQFVDELGPVDNEGHMLYTTIGEGNIILFQNGDVITGTWRKRSLNDRTRFFDSSESEIEFVRGEIWIEAVPEGNKIEY